MSIFVKTIQSPEILDSHYATQFHQEIESLIAAGVKIFYLELNNVTFISNSGLMALISIFISAKAANCKLLLKSSSYQVKMLLELTGLEQAFEVLPELNSSVEDLIQTAKTAVLSK
ncbi:MAG: STAS domain-containing protein [Phormidium sp.]